MLVSANLGGPKLGDLWLVIIVPTINFGQIVLTAVHLMYFKGGTIEALKRIGD